MLERKSQKVLLGVALALLAALVLDQAIIGPLRAYLSETDSWIGELKDEIAEARRLASSAERDIQTAQAIDRRLRIAGEQEQNEFRQHLQALLGEAVEVTSSAQVSVTDMPTAAGLVRILYELHVVGTQEALRTALANLDASRELLRIERLELTNTSLADPALAATLLVSTVASTTATELSSRPYSSPPRFQLPALDRSMFFPPDRLSPGGPAGEMARPEAAAGQFVLLGTVSSPERRAALVEFPATGQTRWVGVGELVGELTVVGVGPEAVSFQLGGQKLSLAIGGSGADLLAGRKLLGGGFELVGVCHGPDQRFAMVQLDDGGMIQRVHVKDRLGAGVIVEIAEDGIVLELAGTQEIVPVGGRRSGRAQM